MTFKDKMPSYIGALVGVSAFSWALHAEGVNVLLIVGIWIVMWTSFFLADTLDRLQKRVESLEKKMKQL